jgi:CDP-diacylglycerol---serine O-phosphatidyltransferase
MKKFIGYYRDCDLLTMTGTCMALLGTVFAINGNKLLPIFCLIVSGICDGFDGKLARRRENTKEQSVYGVQLDSLSDLISFGVFPLVLTVSCLPPNCYYAWIAIIFYSLCGMIRLAYFNTLDICKKNEKGYFIGAPITTISIVYPVVYLFCFFNHFRYFPIIATIFFTLVGISFIYRMKIKKLDDEGKIVLSLIGLLVIIFVLLKVIFHL